MAVKSERLSGKAPAEPEKTAAENESVTNVVSVDGASPQDVETLLAQVADLRKQLEVAEAGRSEAEKSALELAKNQAGSILESVVQEVPTGKQIQVHRCKRYEVVGYKDDGRPIHKPIMAQVSVPTYFYRIDLPPIGGEGLKINGVPLLHGMTLELDLDTLRSVKEMVYRCWKHDQNVHGENENAYRTMANRSFNTGKAVTL